MDKVGGRRLARPVAGFSIPPQATPDLYPALCHWLRRVANSCGHRSAPRRVNAIAAWIFDPLFQCRTRPSRRAATQMDWRRKSTFRDAAVDRRAAERADAHHVSQTIERRCGTRCCQQRRWSVKVHGGVSPKAWVRCAGADRKASVTGNTLGVHLRKNPRGWGVRIAPPTKWSRRRSSHPGRSTELPYNEAVTAARRLIVQRALERSSNLFSVDEAARVEAR